MENNTGITKKYYVRVDNLEEPVNFVGVHPLAWGKEDEPKVGFAEEDEELFTKEQVLSIVDKCFHKYASDFTTAAEIYAKILINNIING